MTDLWPSPASADGGAHRIAPRGRSLATGPLLDFQLAHARARDAVHAPLDRDRLSADLETLGLDVLCVDSAVDDKPTYLMRPDLGRRLAPRCRSWDDYENGGV